MIKPYAIVSDLHLHNWQAFATTQIDGMNSRLTGLISELFRAADELKSAGGNVMYVAGDVFHVRGSVAPSVLNPVMDVFKEIIAMGVEVRMISGNHDLEGKHSEKLGSAITALEGIGVNVCHERTVFSDDKVIMIPWREKLDELRADVIDLQKAMFSAYDLIIHAPLNGVITGLPDHGLSTEEIAKWGFKRVFAGHYHNHKDMGQGVYSVGALAHHTWSDVNSKAGFVIVYPNEVKWFKSHMPEFVDIGADMSELDAELAADGNYVRVKVNSDSKVADIENVREWLTKAGAKGVIVQPVKHSVNVRDSTITASITAGASLEKSVSDYISVTFDTSKSESINLGCQRILAKVNI